MITVRLKLEPKAIEEEERDSLEKIEVKGGIV